MIYVLKSIIANWLYPLQQLMFCINLSRNISLIGIKGQIPIFYAVVV
jgi:hypothetical protein